jgi:uncharacterized protein (TIGR03067 family)
MNRPVRKAAAAAGFISLILALAGAAAQKAPDPKSDRDKAALQGTWKWQSAALAGDPFPASEVRLMAMTFKGDQVMPSSDPTDMATFLLDPSKSPATIDFVDRGKSVDLGIYKIEGDVLTICMALAQTRRPRPAAFDSTRENGALLIVMKKPPAPGK